MKAFLGTIDLKMPQRINLGSSANEARWEMWCRDNVGTKIRIDKPRPIRSLTQNALYHAWLAKVAFETGNLADDLHEYGKMKFLPKRLIKIKGKKGEYDVEALGTTTKLSKFEFSEYMERFSQHVEIPLPTTQELEALGYLSNHV